MKVVSITEVRQNGTRVIREAQQDGEATMVVVKSRPAAYVVGAQHYEALLAENRRLRREALVQRVREAEEEIRRGEYRSFDNVEDLIAHLRSEDSECN